MKRIPETYENRYHPHHTPYINFPMSDAIRTLYFLYDFRSFLKIIIAIVVIVLAYTLYLSGLLMAGKNLWGRVELLPPNDPTHFCYVVIGISQSPEFQAARCFSRKIQQYFEQARYTDDVFVLESSKRSFEKKILQILHSYREIYKIYGFDDEKAYYEDIGDDEVLFSEAEVLIHEVREMLHGTSVFVYENPNCKDGDQLGVIGTAFDFSRIMIQERCPDGEIIQEFMKECGVKPQI